MVSAKTARRLRMLNQKLTGYSANPRSIPKEEREDIAMMMDRCAKRLPGIRIHRYAVPRLYAHLTCRPDIAEYMQ